MRLLELTRRDDPPSRQLHFEQAQLPRTTSHTQTVKVLQ